MSVVPQIGVAAHIPNTVRLKNASDGCEFLSARDYSFDTDGCRKREPQHVSWSKDLKSDAPRVAVVLGYFDGQEYVCDQLRSILDQSHSAVHIYLCDDKSEPRFSFDGLRLDPAKLSQISIGLRPRNVGFTNNFLNALASISDDFEYFAFSDQDDIWHQDKLERALAALAKAPTQKPALYNARTEIADATCESKSMALVILRRSEERVTGRDGAAVAGEPGIGKPGEPDGGGRWPPPNSPERMRE